MEKKGTLRQKRRPKGDPNPQKGPLGDPGTLKGTQLGTVLKKGTENRVQAFIESTSGNWNPDSGVWIELKYCNYSVA